MTPSLPLAPDLTIVPLYLSGLYKERPVHLAVSTISLHRCQQSSNTCKSNTDNDDLNLNDNDADNASNVSNFCDIRNSIKNKYHIDQSPVTH